MTNTNTLSTQIKRYADLLINTGVNLQPGQSLRIGAELEYAPFVRIATAAAYKAAFSTGGDPGEP